MLSKLSYAFANLLTFWTPDDKTLQILKWFHITIPFLFIHNSVYQEGLESIVDTYVKEVVKTGLLTKKGHKVKSLKQRWFVLQPDKFSYYTSKSCKELKGVIAINEETTVENIRDSRSVKCRFTVTCGDKNVPYEMDAPDQRTKNEWITAIQTCIGK